MSISDEKGKIPSFLNYSWETWDFMIKEAGLDAEKYDRDLVKDVCRSLGLPVSCRNVSRELETRNVSQELLIGAFLKAIQPFARMMVDICSFFCAHGIRSTNDRLRILFDFGKGPEDLGFDLRNFREIIYKYSKIAQNVGVYGWNYDTLWMLAQVFSKYREYQPKNATVTDWLESYRNRKLLPVPCLLISKRDDAVQWLERAWQVLANVMNEYAKYSLDLDDLKACEEQQRVDLASDTRDESPITEEIPNLEEWDLRTLISLDSDRWPEMMLRGLSGFAENLMEATLDGKEKENTRKGLQDLFQSIPHWTVKREMLIQELLELLDLPIWQKRYELYQTWVMTQIDYALSVFDHVIHQVSGELLMSFAGTHVGTAETDLGRVHLWSELRSPFTKLTGKGRKAHIQPDYSLTLEPITNPSQTLVVIECKQYSKANLKNFSQAITDYARGRPNATIILVNYGKVPERIFRLLDDDVKDRTLVIGSFVPGRLEESTAFAQRVRESLGKQSALNGLLGAFDGNQFDLICVDVSGSMKEPLEEEMILQLLHMLVHCSRSARLVAVDRTVREEWDYAESGLPKLLKLSRNGGTDISMALSEYDLKRALVLTDSEGFRQLSSKSQQIHLVIEVQTKETLCFHIS